MSEHVTGGATAAEPSEQSLLHKTEESCLSALDWIAVERLSSIPELLVESGEESRRTSVDLVRFAIVRELLNRMDVALRRGAKQRDTERKRLAASWEEYRRRRRQRNLGPAADLPADLREEGEAIVDGGLAGTKAIQAVLQAYHDVRAQLDEIRKRARNHRRLSRSLHAGVLVALGLGFGVVVVQLVQNWVQDFSTLGAWLVAIGAWVALDYVLEPRLYRWLTRRSVRLVRDEVVTTFAAWRDLRDYEKHCNQTLKDLGEQRRVELLSAFATLTQDLDLDRLDWRHLLGPK